MREYEKEVGTIRKMSQSHTNNKGKEIAGIRINT